MTTYIFLYGLQQAENFINAYDKTIILSYSVDELRRHAWRIDNLNPNRDLNPKEWEVSDNHEILPAWRIGYVKNEDEEKCFIDKVYTVLYDNKHERYYLVSKSITDKDKYVLKPMPANDPVTGEYLYISSELPGAPKRFSKPSLKAIEAWEDWCDNLLSEHTEKKILAAAKLRASFNAFLKAVPDLSILEKNGGTVTKFSFIRGFLCFLYTGDTESGRWYRDVSIHWQSVPTDEDILSQTKNN